MKSNIEKTFRQKEIEIEKRRENAGRTNENETTDTQVWVTISGR
jgi:hypothetical protein